MTVGYIVEKCTAHSTDCCIYFNRPSIPYCTQYAFRHGNLLSKACITRVSFLTFPNRLKDFHAVVRARLKHGHMILSLLLPPPEIMPSAIALPVSPSVRYRLLTGQIVMGKSESFVCHTPINSGGGCSCYVLFLFSCFAVCFRSLKKSNERFLLTQGVTVTVLGRRANVCDRGFERTS